jgi:hypothetical protein
MDGTNNHAVCVCTYHTAPQVLHRLYCTCYSVYFLATDQGRTGATRWLRRQCKRYHNIAQHTLAEPFRRLYRPHYRVSRSVAVDSSSICFVLATCHATSVTRLPRYPDPTGAVSTGGRGGSPTGQAWSDDQILMRDYFGSWVR